METCVHCDKAEFAGLGACAECLVRHHGADPADLPELLATATELHHLFAVVRGVSELVSEFGNIRGSESRDPPTQTPGNQGLSSL